MSSKKWLETSRCVPNPLLKVSPMLLSHQLIDEAILRRWPRQPPCSRWETNQVMTTVLSMWAMTSQVRTSEKMTLHNHPCASKTTLRFGKENPRQQTLLKQTFNYRWVSNSIRANRSFKNNVSSTQQFRSRQTLSKKTWRCHRRHTGLLRLLIRVASRVAQSEVKLAS